MVKKEEFNSLLNEIQSDFSTRKEQSPGQIKYSKQKENSEKHKDYIKELAENSKISERLRREINKSNDKEEMLEKALECISLMTGDKVFYTLNITKVKKDQWVAPHWSKRFESVTHQRVTLIL